MPADKPVKLPVKLPVPVISVVLLSEIVGVAPVLQQMPRIVTVAPPSLRMFPPLFAESLVISVASDVVKTGGVSDSVLNETALP